MPQIGVTRRAQVPAGLQRRKYAGFTYLVVLFIVTLMGVALTATGALWHTAQMRDKEQELLYIGNQYREAIRLYYMNSPGPAKQYPRELGHLLKDPRLPVARRYLRKLYRDPITGKNEWGIIKAADGGIAGVYSLSEATPFKTANFKKTDADFEAKTKYSDWKFAYLPATPVTPAPPQVNTRKP